jgi:hypothetical protein
MTSLWWRVGDSNFWPRQCECCAVPTKLTPLGAQSRNRTCPPVWARHLTCRVATVTPPAQVRTLFIFTTLCGLKAILRKHNLEAGMGMSLIPASDVLLQQYEILSAVMLANVSSRERRPSMAALISLCWSVLIGVPPLPVSGVTWLRRCRFLCGQRGSLLCHSRATSFTAFRCVGSQVHAFARLWRRLLYPPS